jgi:hypothetical protein
MYKNVEKIRRNCYFLQCNGMQGMFKLENNIVVTNGRTRYKLKQGHKIVFFNSNTLIEFIKVS